jgi:DHA2 family lincomycin resistance protein-like MFS transporter
MISLGFMFTPLFSVSMMRVPMHQYSHGSSITGATQQVFGAAGTALFVTILTIEGLAATKAGATAQESVAAGVHSAFLVGAIISLVAIGMSFWLEDSKKLIAQAAAESGGAPTGGGQAVAGH